MDQSVATMHFPLDIQSVPQTRLPRSTTSRLECPRFGCGKTFHRKEHLTRHLKSHDPQRQHECPICQRRYVRSDVLKRHVENHTQDTHSKRALAACASCHEQERECDDDIPCRPCTQDLTECSRAGQAADRGVGVGVGNDIVEGNEKVSNDDPMLGSEMSQIVQMAAVLPSSDSSPSWFQFFQDGSTPPLSISTGLTETSSNDLNTSGLALGPSEIGGQGRGDDAIPTLPTQDLSFLFSVSGAPYLEHSTTVSRYDLNQCDRRVSLLAPHPGTSSNLPQEIRAEDLDGCFGKESSEVRRLVQVYFAKIHPSWPILHAPTFDAAQIPHILLGSMMVLATWLEDEADHMGLASLVFDAVTTILLDSQRPHCTDVRPDSLHTLQALLLCVVYTTSHLTTDGMMAKAVNFNSMLISTCRNLGVFDGQSLYHGFGDCPFAFWLAEEQIHRLAFSVLCVDAYLSVLVDHPPSARYQEICLPLPKSSQLWTAASDDERRSLQWNEPSGREKIMFCFLMRDALDLNRPQHWLPYRLTGADYHLTICALQVGVWEAARDIQICESDELVTNSVTGDSLHLWRTLLDCWWAKMEEECKIRHNYFSANTSGAECAYAPLSIILWHVSSLTLHAPVKVLQGQGHHKKGPASTSTTMTQRIQAWLRAWLAKPCARTAVWNAAQISCVVAHEWTDPSRAARLQLNPLAIPALLKSAIVTCWYAHHTRACHACNSGPPSQLVDLFDIEDKSGALARWKEEGLGLAIWGPTEMPLCHCKVMALATWFRGALARDHGAEMEFMSFVACLTEQCCFADRDMSVT